MNVLKCEFVKLRKCMSFKITLAVVWAVSLLYGFMIIQAAENHNRGQFDGLNVMIASLQDNMLYVIIGSIIAALFICSDFENRTIQESITCGNSHFSIVASKAFVYTVSVIVISLPYPIISAAVVASKYGWGWDIYGASSAELVGKMLLAGVTILFAYLPTIMFFVFTSFLVRKIGVSFAVNIPVMLVGSELILNIISSLSDKVKFIDLIYDYSMFGVNYKPFEYMNVFSENVLANVNIQNYLPIIIAGIVWSALLLAASVAVFKKIDLK